MAKEYISRDKMIEQTKSRIVIGAPRYNDGLRTAIEVATSIPAADVVEVVRCRDCKFAHLTYSGECKYCDNLIEDGVDEAVYLPGDFYCANGERKYGGNEK